MPFAPPVWLMVGLILVTFKPAVPLVGANTFDIIISLLVPVVAVIDVLRLLNTIQFCAVVEPKY